MLYNLIACALIHIQTTLVRVICDHGSYHVMQEAVRLEKENRSCVHKGSGPGSRTISKGVKTFKNIFSHSVNQSIGIWLLNLQRQRSFYVRYVPCEKVGGPCTNTSLIGEKLLSLVHALHGNVLCKTSVERAFTASVRAWQALKSESSMKPIGPAPVAAVPRSIAA